MKSMEARQARVYKAQYGKAIKEKDESIKYAMDEQNMAKWYILLHNFSGNNDEYLGGEYIVRIELTNDFPYDPPHFYFMTPNGLYEVEKKVCISIGEFHKDQYPAALGVGGFCKQLLSGLIGWEEIGSGISIINTSEEKKKALAADSTEYNRTNNAMFMALIDSSYDSYSKKW
jgi:ubiquitin-conjugating enzyme E2 J2